MAGVFRLRDHAIFRWLHFIRFALERQFIPEFEEFLVGQEDAFAAVFESLLKLVVGHVDGALAFTDGVRFADILTVHFDLHLDRLAIRRDHRGRR